MKPRIAFRRHLFKVITLILVGLIVIIGPSRPVHAQSPSEHSDVVTTLEANATARVLVALRSPSAGVTVGLQLQSIAQTQAAVLGQVPDEDFRLIYRYQTVPGLAGEVTKGGLAVLLEQPEVAAVALDLPVEAVPSQTAAIAGTSLQQDSLDFSGAGVNVAVLDTGVDLSHPDLADSVIAQKCFNRDDCPPGNTDEGEEAQDENGHGTHVAGIITGDGQTSPRGIAPETGLVAVRVLGSSGVGFTSDVISGLDWVIAHQADYNIKLINLSLGGGAYDGVCDDVDATTRLYAETVRIASEAGLTIFAASGNQGLSEQMMAPACVSGVLSVGSTYGTAFDSFSFGSVCSDDQPLVDQVACASNSSPALDLLAPGVAIESTALGGGSEVKSGTSMSTALATAVSALLLEADPELAPTDIEMILKETGLPITDHRNDRVTPRIDQAAALTHLVGGEFITFSGTVLLQGRTDHGDTSIFLSETACATSISEAPMALTNADGSFEITVPADRDYPCVQAVQAGYLVGQRSLPPAQLGTIILPAGDVTGDNKIDIFDLSFIAARYKSNDPVADVNASSWVDIFDLVLAAGNYNREGPVTDWENEAILLGAEAGQ